MGLKIQELYKETIDHDCSDKYDVVLFQKIIIFDRFAWYR